MPRYGWAFLLALAISLLGTPVVRAISRRLGLIAKPRPDRWSQKPTALYGGIAMFVGFMGAFVVFHDASKPGAGLLVACASSMFALGLIDDIIHVKPYVKLVGQLMAATALTTFGLKLSWTSSAVFNQAITVFWLVGVTNALNLLDNIDGLAAGIAVIAAAFMTYFFVVGGQPAAATLSAAFAGAVIGFLVFNFHPASIFMGDCGSLFLGFFLGGAGLLQDAHRSRSLVALAPPILILAIPILDTTLVTISRRLHGRPISQGGRDHTSHRLVALGLSERSATLTLYGLAVASGLTGVAARHFPASITMGLLPVFLMLLLFVAVYLGRVKVYQENKQGGTVLPTLADFTYKRRIFEVLNDFVLIVLCYYCAFLLRFEGQLVQPHWAKFLQSLPLVLTVQIAVFLLTGMYRGLWRYTSIDDLLRFWISVAVAVGCSVIAVWAAFRGLAGFSRAAFILDGILLFMGISGSRVSFRLMRNWLVRQSGQRTGRRVLIYGAGDAGELLLRELQNNEDLGLVPIGFVDDDRTKIGKVIHGVRVMGDSDRLEELLASLKVEELVISSGKVDQLRLAAVAELCQRRAVACRRARFAFE